MELLKTCEGYYLSCKLGKTHKPEIYYIELNSNNTGFFALLRAALDGCCYADENGFQPYIKYGKEILYAENFLGLKINNPFEYYFEQPGSINKFTDLIGINVIRHQPKHIEMIELKYNLKPLSYLMEEAYILRMSDVYKKYIRLNKKTSCIIERGIKKTLKGKRTLGVHIRGTDFYKGFNNHPIPATVDEYIEIIKREVESHCYEQVFVATDDDRCLKELKKGISVPLVYYRDTVRTDENRSVAFMQNNRNHNHYLLGLDVLRDTYTLVACDGFAGCLSQIDTFVQIIKMSQGQKFASLDIINKGIFINDRQCWEPHN